MKFIYVGFLVAVALVILFYAYYGLVRWRTRRQDQIIRALQRKIDDLHAAEPEKLKRLREELIGYDNMTDEILDALVQGPGMLSLSDPREHISNIIIARRPKRTL